MKNIELTCFGGNDWWYHNRNHFDVRMIEEFAKFGNVLYVNSVIMQQPKLSQGREFITKVVRKTKSILKGIQMTERGFVVCSPLSLPFYHVVWIRLINEKLLRIQVRKAQRKCGIRMPIVWVGCPTACDVAVKMKKAKLVYQRTDRFEEYPNVDTETIRQYDRKLKAAAELTVFVNRVLYTEEMDQCRKALYLEHGVDYGLFATAEMDKEVPPDMRDVDGPVVGFFGGIDNHTTDIDLVQKVVELLPEISFVFVGKSSIDCQNLLSRKNVRMLGQKPYEQIPHYGKCFDVAIMPWRQNRWIEACNPIKLKEYLALGKPIVSTPFPELEKYRDVVYEARSPEDFAKCIEKALDENNIHLVSARRKKVEQVSWDNKAQMVLQELFRKNSDCQEHN